MPNPNPTRRARTAPSGAELLPPGFDRRPDGRLRLRYTPAPGTPRREVYGWSVDECNAKRYAPPPAPVIVNVGGSITLAEHLERWSGALTGRANSNATHVANVAHLGRMFGERVTLEELATPAGRELIRTAFAELRAYVSPRTGRPLAPRSVALVHATLRRSLTVALEDGRIGSNPAARLNVNGATGRANRARRVGTELRIPTDAELRLVAAELAPADRRLFELAVLTGLRQSEELGLGADAIDGPWCHVHRALRRGTAELDDPKSSTSDRFVPFGPSAARVVAEVEHEAKLARIAAGPRWSGNPLGLLFTDELGRPLNGSSLSHRLEAAIARAGVPAFRWHDLRHAYASGLINRGVPIALVSKYLGHASVAITSEVYHHLIRTDDHGAAIAAAESILGLAR